MGGLNAALEAACDKEKLKGFQIPNGGPILSHLSLMMVRYLLVNGHEKISKTLPIQSNLFMGPPASRLIIINKKYLESVYL